MKTKLFFLVVIVFYCFNVSAQPYTLDRKIKPLELKLTEHPEYKKAKYAENNFRVETGGVNYHYVTGHDVFEYVDIFIFSNNENTDLQADLVYNTWSNIEESKTTHKAENGIINFKVRSWQDISFTIKSTESQSADYGIIVNSSEPVMEYLESPFVASSKDNLEELTTNSLPEKTNEEMPWLLFLFIGILVLLVGFLGGRLLRYKKTIGILLFLVSLNFSFTLYGQATYVENAKKDALESELEYRRERNKINASTREHIKTQINKINNAFATANAVKNLISQYRNLGSCMGTGNSLGQPKIPSFCVDEEKACADCFKKARTRFNKSRYNLEKLQTVYDCAKSFADASVALGDNVSGYHGLSGLAWQSERRKIMKSVNSLNKAYDKKRAEFLESFNKRLLELARCEEKHGIKDWYDRFGIMYYNFAEIQYHR